MGGKVRKDVSDGLVSSAGDVEEKISTGMFWHWVITGSSEQC